MEIFSADTLTEKERTTLGNYFRIQKKLKSFANNCNLSTFQALFGKEEGKRLWHKFAVDCDRKINRWFTYLVQEQSDLFWIQLIKYENLAKGIL